jgi:hypothetical protein
MDDLLQVTPGDGRVAVPLADHLSLLGDADAAAYCPWWLG